MYTQNHLQNHHLSQDYEPVQYSSGPESLCPLANPPPDPPRPPVARHRLLSLTGDQLAFSSILWPWNHDLCDCFCLASFTRCSSSEIHPWSTNRAHSFSRMSSIPWPRQVTAGLSTHSLAVDMWVLSLWGLDNKVFKSLPRRLPQFLLSTYLEWKGQDICLTF